MQRKTSWLLDLFTVIVDAVMMIAAFFAAYYLRKVTEYPRPLDPRPFSYYGGMLLIHTGTLLATFFIYRLYHFKPGLSRIDKSYSLMAAISFGTVASVALTSFVYKNELDYPRAMVVYAWILSIVLAMVGRLLTDWLRGRYRVANPTRVLIVGAGDVGRMILQKISQSPNLGYQPVGFADDTPGRKEVSGLPVLGPTHQLRLLLQEHNVQEVIIGLPEASHEELLDLISQAEREKATVRVFPDVFQIIASEISIDDLNGLPLLTVRDVASARLAVGPQACHRFCGQCDHPDPALAVPDAAGVPDQARFAWPCVLCSGAYGPGRQAFPNAQIPVDARGCRDKRRVQSGR